MPPNPSRLAVQLHNRKHPIPAGVWVVLFLVFLIIAGFYVASRPTDQSREAERLREDLRRQRQELDERF